MRMSKSNARSLNYNRFKNRNIQSIYQKEWSLRIPNLFLVLDSFPLICGNPPFRSFIAVLLVIYKLLHYHPWKTMLLSMLCSSRRSCPPHHHHHQHPWSFVESVSILEIQLAQAFEKLKDGTKLQTLI